MRKKLSLLFILSALSYQTASATSLLETFGSGANAFTMDFVTIGNPNNVADTTGWPNPVGTGWRIPVGSVGYAYNMGMYEVSRTQFDKANSAGSLGITLQDMSPFGGNGVLKPATGVSWYEAAKFVNWLNTSTGNTAAYKFDGSGAFQLWAEGDAGYNANNLFRNSLAKYVIASSNEWYKAAYGNLDGTWNNYPTGSDSVPTAVTSGTAPNTAVYGNAGQYGPADINDAGGLSPYGTMGQGGNALEWTETAYDGSNNITGENRDQLGGSWYYGAGDSIWLDASGKDFDDPANDHFTEGFRVASVPEPSALSLLAFGLSGLAMIRRRKK